MRTFPHARQRAFPSLGCRCAVLWFGAWDTVIISAKNRGALEPVREKHLDVWLCVTLACSQFSIDIDAFLKNMQSQITSSVC